MSNELSKCSIGWISNVAGRLFFNLSDPFNYRLDRIVGDVFHYNKKTSEDSKRTLYTTMLIDVRDQYYHDTIKNLSKYTRVIVLGQTKEVDKLQKHLNGCLYFLDAKDRNIKEKDYLIKVKQKTMDSSLTSDNLYEQMSELTNDLIESLEQSHTITKLDFSIHNTGFIYIKEVIENKNNPKTQQAFYLLKYLFHKHVHHRPTQENISQLYRLTEEQYACIIKKAEYRFSDCGLELAQKILTDIKRHIAEVRKYRGDQPEELHDLKGIIEYTQTLLLTFFKEGILSHENDSHKIFKEQESAFLSNIGKSIDNALVKKPYRNNTVYQFIDDTQKFMVIALAIMGPYTILKSKIEMIDINIFLSTTFVYGYLIIFMICFFLSNSIYAFYGRNRNTFLTIPFDRFSDWILLLFKKHNFYTLSRLTYVIPELFVNTEMFIRRNNQSIVNEILLSVIIVIIIIAIGAYFFPDKFDIDLWTNLNTYIKTIVYKVAEWIKWMTSHYGVLFKHHLNP